MSENRVLLLEGQLSVQRDTGRILLRSPERPDRFINPSDIAVLIIDSPAVVLSSAAMRLLAESGCVVLLTNERHMPLAHVMPEVATTRCVQRLRQQIDMQDRSLASDLWRDIVAARIRTQARVLRDLNRQGALYLERLATKVDSGDSANCEAQAAKHFWKHLWPTNFRREKQGAEDLCNASLNYGYAVIRSLVARSLSAAGLNMALGIAHTSEKNPFNLADDFIEPYRFVVEQHVAEILDADAGISFDAATRARIAGCVARELHIGDEVFRLPAAIDATVSSFTRTLDSLQAPFPLQLPAGLAG